MHSRSTRVGIVLADTWTAEQSGVAEQSRAPAAVVHGGHPIDTPYAALIPPEVRLHRHFIERVDRALATVRPGTCLYTDFTVAGQPVHVGDWSVERARWQDFTGPVMVVPGRLADDPEARIMAPRRSGFVEHVAECLYDAPADRVRYLSAEQQANLTSDLPYRIAGSPPRRRLPSLPSTALVIPTRLAGPTDTDDTYLDQCLESLGDLLDHPAIRVVVVVDDNVPAAPIGAWRRRLSSRLTVVTTELPFNFATKINAGVSATDCDYLVLLNDDVAAVDDHWLEQMLALASEPDVGAVGALLVYPDGTVQHRGHAFGPHGVHLVDSGRSPGPGPRNRNLVDRDVTGVTAACLVQRRDVWERVGGMDPAFPVAFNDVDYCERIRRQGLRIVLCNTVQLIHHESRTRRGTAQQWEVDLLRDRWPDSWGHPDPLTPDSEPALPVGRLSRIRRRLTRRSGGDT